MEFLQNIEGERAGHAKGEVVDEHSISTLVSTNIILLVFELQHDNIGIIFIFMEFYCCVNVAELLKN